MNTRPKRLARKRDARFDGGVAPVWHDEARERRQARRVLRRLPRKTGRQVRPIMVEIAAEQLGHENRDHRHGPPESREFARKPHVDLIGAVAV